MARYVALLRGINVGTANLVSMVDLRSATERGGARDVTTILRSGNVVFTAEAAPAPGSLEREVRDISGVSASVVIVDGEHFLRILEANPLLDVATDFSKLTVTFSSAELGSVELPDAETLGDERIVIGEHAIYQWLPNGTLATRIHSSFWRQFAGTLTTRNWRTVQRIATHLR